MKINCPCCGTSIELKITTTTTGGGGGPGIGGTYQGPASGMTVIHGAGGGGGNRCKLSPISCILADGHHGHFGWNFAQ